MSKRPIFPITEKRETKHFSDYGFDLQLQFSYFDFQVLEAATRHSKRGGRKNKLHQLRHTSSAASAARKCLRSAGSTLLFWNWNWNWNRNRNRKRSKKDTYHGRSYSRQPCSASYPTSYSTSYYSASAPLYMTDCYSRPETAMTCRAKSGPLTAGPYFNLSELNLTSGPQSGSAGAMRPMPVYLVT